MCAFVPVRRVMSVWRGSRRLIGWQHWHRARRGSAGREWHELLAAERVDITGADTICCKSSPPAQREEAGQFQPAETSHHGKNPLLSTGGICRWAVGRDVLLESWRTAQWSEIDPRLEGSLIGLAVSTVETDEGPCHSQWSSSVTQRVNKTRVERSVFTQVCVVACQLLWNNIESRLKAQLHA